MDQCVFLLPLRRTIKDKPDVHCQIGNATKMITCNSDIRLDLQECVLQESHLLSLFLDGKDGRKMKRRALLHVFPIMARERTDGTVAVSAQSASLSWRDKSTSDIPRREALQRDSDNVRSSQGCLNQGKVNNNKAFEHKRHPG